VLGNDWEHFSAVCFFFGRRLADYFKVGLKWLVDGVAGWVGGYVVRWHTLLADHLQLGLVGGWVGCL
jgi:hypothetical protein